MDRSPEVNHLDSKVRKGLVDSPISGERSIQFSTWKISTQGVTPELIKEAGMAKQVKDGIKLGKNIEKNLTVGVQQDCSRR